MKRTFLATLVVLFVSCGVMMADTERIVAKETHASEKTSEEPEEYFMLSPLPSSAYPEQIRFVPKQVAWVQWSICDYAELHAGECWSFTLDDLSMKNYEQIVDVVWECAEWLNLTYNVNVIDDENFQVTFENWNYQIKAGDTLSELALKYNVTVDEIVALNPAEIRDPNLIYSGHIIQIKKIQLN